MKDVKYSVANFSCHSERSEESPSDGMQNANNPLPKRVSGWARTVGRGLQLPVRSGGDAFPRLGRWVRSRRGVLLFPHRRNSSYFFLDKKVTKNQDLHLIL